MDGLSGAASIITVVELAGKIASKCYTFYVAVKDARKDIQKLQTELISLQQVLTQLVDHLPQLMSIDANKQNALSACQGDLNELSRLLDHARGNDDNMRKFGLRALRWPLSAKELDRYLTVLGRHRGSLSLAVNAQILEHTSTLLKSSEEVHTVISKLQIDGTDQKLKSWLCPPDRSFYLDMALEKRVVPGTGAWFLESATYTAWTSQASSFLWLHGIPGAGKTVLSATAIASLAALVRSKQQSSLAYFFFDSSATRDKNPSSMVRSLLWQIMPTSEATKQILEKCHERAQSSIHHERTRALLLEALRAMILSAGQIFIVLDALDESSELQQLLDNLQTMQRWALPNLHVLCTSREFAVIEESMTKTKHVSLRVEGKGIDADIEAYIDYYLRSNKTLNRWSAEVKAEVRASMISNAGGMFRWVQCQIDALSRCRTPKAVRQAMASLPKTLSETYERILLNIEQDDREYARKILKWLACALRPLSVNEIAQVTGIDDVPKTLDTEDCIIASDIGHILPGLVDLSSDSSTEGQVIRLAHSSVKDYLLSKEILLSNAADFGVLAGADAPHTDIAMQSIGYLRSASAYADDKSLANVCDRYPLSAYCAQFWMEHARLGQLSLQHEETIREQSDFLNSASFIKTLTLFDIDHQGPHLTAEHDVISPLYYAALSGLYGVASRLIRSYEDLNALHGSFRTLLHAAVAGGHVGVVALFLDNGVDINASSQRFGTALQLAAAKNRYQIVELLLERGADPNLVREGVFGSALLAATYHGNSAVIELLLKHNARLSTEGLRKTDALHLAALKGDLPDVKVMLNAGASANNIGRWETPLIAAMQSSKTASRYDIVETLLNHGASPTGSYPDSEKPMLLIAVESGDFESVRVLLQSDILRYASRKTYDQCLRAAHASRDSRLTSLFASITFQGDRYPESLSEAMDTNLILREILLETENRRVFADSLKKEQKIAERLEELDLFNEILEKSRMWEDFQIPISPLIGACWTQDAAIVRVLLQKGAKLSHDRLCELEAAVPNTEIVETLIQYGLDLAGASSAALCKAVRSDNITLIDKILGSGAVVDEVPYWNEESLYRSDLALVGDATPLIHAARMGCLHSVTLLLDKGASAARHSVQMGTALHALAMCNRRPDVTKIAELLIAHGADLSATNHSFGTPLHAAACADSPDLIELLVCRGAEIDERLPSKSKESDDPKSKESDDPDRPITVVKIMEAGSTPLHCSLRRRHLRASEALIAQGASTTITVSSRRETAIDCLLNGLDDNDVHPPRNMVALLNLLLDHGAKNEERCEGS